MAPHLSPAELDWMQKLDRSGKTPVQIHASLTARRSRRHVASPNLTNIRKAIKGLTYKRGPKETRGRKPTYSKKWVKALNTARKKLLLTCAQSREVRWRDVVQKARAPKAHRSTVKRAFDRDGVKGGIWPAGSCRTPGSRHWPAAAGRCWPAAGGRRPAGWPAGPN